MDRVVNFSHGDVVKVHTRQLEAFKKIARENQDKKRYRLCLHDSPDNKLQDMIICMSAGDYARPHKHHNMPESHMILAGRMAIVLFNDDGVVTDAFVMDRGSDYLAYRVNADVYHMTILLSDSAIEYEVKPGPFEPSNNIFPLWAPSGEDKRDAMEFMKRTRERIFERFPHLRADV